ncbi:hypothetical protein [Aliarcobacter cryaerophilus]|uniref:hypothetical protein n=1 Tax=Aliarcobacter cryaerophilus TaxID=28198 RepID=UPI0021B3F9AB|nr:hypothetical protein [Aliarcobacter cryaerophilus]MCT7405240.1 hypothetical protein [Aliarcobacter cryaerophilus]MCT7431755.1 hypothetical protein [Aliarcobacter cryaerophilus]MCT7502719.1 hypothetical protein [Aliarcobacter cryaerophilus]
MSLFKELKKLETSDYQNRKDKYPASNIPDTIKFQELNNGISVEFEFKNTSEQEALDWFNISKESLIFNKYKTNYNLEIQARQDGDYPDDWVILTVNLIKKSVVENKKVKQEIEKTNVDDNKNTIFLYTYILSNPTQIKEINLLDYKDSLETVIKSYLDNKLIDLQIDKSSYILNLNTKLEVGAKRRLGRLISQNTELKKHVRKISYNNSQDKSGQLFVLKETKKEVNG